MRRRTTSAADAPLRAFGDALRRARARRRAVHRRLAWGAIGCAAALLPALVPPAPRLIWNASASAPIGLYAVHPGAAPQVGDMVAARLPAGWRDFAALRHYLPANVPLVKRVAAVPGDSVCAKGDLAFVRGRVAALRRPRDRYGRPLPQWQGCRTLASGQLFLLMDHPDSFDGRYFGTSEAGDVIGKARLLWAR